MVTIEEIGERLRAVVREDPEVPASLRKKIDRPASSPIVPTMEHGRRLAMVEFPTKLDSIINLKAASTLGMADAGNSCGN